MTKTTRRGLVIIGVIVAGLMAIGFMARSARRPAHGSLVEIYIGGEIPEWVGDEPLSGLFGGKQLVLRDYVEAILRARDDERIKGLLVTIDAPSLGFARFRSCAMSSCGSASRASRLSPTWRRRASSHRATRPITWRARFPRSGWRRPATSI